MREKIPSDILFVCESGVKDGKDIEVIAKMGADAALIGETLMRAEDKKTLLQQFLRRLDDDKDQDLWIITERRH